jgi:hypothetical protein
MINLHPDVLVIDNTLEGDRRTYVVSNYGVPYVRLDAIPNGRVMDEIAAFMGLLAVFLFAAADGNWWLVGLTTLAMCVTAWFGVRFYRQWKAIKDVVAEVEAGKCP